MNKHLFTAALLLTSFSVFSQDILKRKDGTELQVVVLNKDGKEIEYKLFNFQSGQSFKIDKKDVLYVQAASGSIERFDEPVQQAAQSNTTTSYNTSTEDKGISQVLNKLNSTLDNLSKGQNNQSKTLSDVITQLNQNIVQLKEANEKSTLKSEQQNAEIINKLTTLNNSITSIQEINNGQQKDEIKPRKFGLGISYATNLLLDAFSSSDDEDFSASYKGLYGGAGLNLVISTRMDKKVGFRYEPEFSIASAFASSGIGNTSRTSFFSMGSRFFAVVRRKRVNIYAGPSITFFGVIATGGSGNGDASGGGGFGLHFGGEYLISSHFGINLESGMQLYGFFPKNRDSNGVFSTYGRVGGRFYF
ncbi:MAG TPA: hypothetical protein PLM55_01190 [Chitinophagales bacterium]|nr:hypothetical protein [Chitinophagales bacterium]